jgi:RND family efflux transporter MFP subunit
MNFKYQISMLFLAMSFVACKENKTTESKLPASRAIAVKTIQLQQSEGLVEIKSTGMLTTEDEAKYAFKIGGVIDKIYVNEGQFFKKGNLLAQLKIEEIDAGFVQAQLGVDKAQRDLQRVRNLYKDSVATLEQLQNTKTAFDFAKKQLEAVAFNKSYANIYAANDGFVTKKIANEGEILTGGMPVLAINENLNGAWLLKVGVSDRDWEMTKVGNTAQVMFDAFPDKVFKGSVIRKLLAADMATGSFQVEIKVNFQEITPAIGMFGKAIIRTNIFQKYQPIPYDAIVEADGKNAFVFIPLPNGKVKKQPIEMESFDGKEVKIKSGLENIKEVVLTNSAFLNENSTITIIK